MAPKADEITQALKDLLEDNKLQLGLEHIEYGDPQLIPKYPSATVSTATKRRDIQNTGHFLVTYEDDIVVQYGKVQSQEVNRQQMENHTENVETVLHGDYTLGGRLIDSYVVRIDFGVLANRREKQMIHAARLRWAGLTKEVR